MSLREDLSNSIINKIMPMIKESDLDEIRMQIELAMYPYDIVQAERELVVYKKNETELAMQRFIAAKIARGCSPNTIEYYSNTLRFLFFEKLNKPYDQVTADDLRYYFAMRVNVDKVTKTTADNERRVLSSFYNWLSGEEVLIRNPMVKVDKIKKTKIKKQAFSHMEVEMIRNACRTNREKAFVEVLLSTWVRVSELIQIKISSIRDDEIVVRGKGDKERIVYLNPKAILAINNYLAERSDKNPYLFPAAKYAGAGIKEFTKHKKRKEEALWYKDPSLVSDGGCMSSSSMEAIARKLGKRAKVENVHPHRFRRTGATHALQAGMPLLTVSKLLGHEQLETTQIYLDISDAELRDSHSKYVI